MDSIVKWLKSPTALWVFTAVVVIACVALVWSQ